MSRLSASRSFFLRQPLSQSAGLLFIAIPKYELRCRAGRWADLICAAHEDVGNAGVIQITDADEYATTRSEFELDAW